MILRKNLLTLLFFTTVFWGLEAQFTKYDVTNSGIYNNYIQACCEDTKGNLWFGTRNGISMFDGTNWTQYNNTNSVVNGVIGKIMEYNGDVYAISWTSPNIPNVKPPIIYNSGIIYKFNGATWKVFFSSSTESLTDLAFDKDKTAWITTVPNGLIKYDGQEVKYFNRKTGHLNSDSIWCIEIDNVGIKWLGTWKSGLMKFQDTMVVSKYNVGVNGLCSDFVRCMYYDKEKDLMLLGSWDRCMTTLNLKTGVFQSYNSGNSGLSLDMIEGITEYGGRYWICSQSLSTSNNGAYSWDGKYAWTNYKPSHVVYCLSPYKSQQKIVLGTVQGAFLYDLPNARVDKTNAEENVPYKIVDNNSVLFSGHRKSNVINIFNRNGQRVMQFFLPANQTSMTITNLPPGIYIIELDNHWQQIIIF